MTFVLRRATPDDVASVAELLKDASQWLESRGSNQWQYPAPVHFIEDRITHGRVYLALSRSDGSPAGTITIDERADPDFWTQADQPNDALYVHRMAVARRYSGMQLGGGLLDFAGDLAAGHRRTWLRLDAWKNNNGLHRYYESQDFELVRVVDLPHRQSGALFERPARYHKLGSDNPLTWPYELAAKSSGEHS